MAGRKMQEERRREGDRYRTDKEIGKMVQEREEERENGTGKRRREGERCRRRVIYAGSEKEKEREWCRKRE
jgi:hypothetical protein